MGHGWTLIHTDAIGVGANRLGLLTARIDQDYSFRRMGSFLDHLIAEVRSVYRAGDIRAAMAAADRLVERFPGEKRAWSFRAHLHRVAESLAISDLTAAIRISPHDSNEPYLYFFRGACLLREERQKEALEDFTAGLGFCDLYMDDYYRETLFFFRAYTLIRLGRASMALRDLENVDESFSFWIDKLQTKVDLLRKCMDSG
jgi:tetratricopeptide (TPR) repeat protein